MNHPGDCCNGFVWNKKQEIWWWVLRQSRHSSGNVWNTSATCQAVYFPQQPCSGHHKGRGTETKRETRQAPDGVNRINHHHHHHHHHYHLTTTITTTIMTMISMMIATTTTTTTTTITTTTTTTTMTMMSFFLFHWAEQAQTQKCKPHPLWTLDSRAKHIYI